MSAVLRHVLLLQKDVRKAANFYQQGLGLPVNVLTEKWAELQAGNSKIALKAVDGCAGPLLSQAPNFACAVFNIRIML